MFYIVYKTTNLINNKIYIGIHATKDLNDGYIGSGSAIKMAIKKYGKENFKRDVVAIFDNPSDMLNLESELVNSEFVSKSNNYNLTQGGQVYNGSHNSDYFGSEKHISQAISVLLKNQKKGSERRRWLLYNNNDWAERYKESLSEGIKKYYDNGGKSGFKGRSHSKKSILKIKQKSSGKLNSQYGTIWICNDLTKKVVKIKKEEFCQWQDKGWRRGRKPT